METPSGTTIAAEKAARNWDRVFWAGLGLLALALFKLGSQRALWDPGESRYAEISREMLESGNLLVPHLNYVPYFEKPPLAYWLNALAMKVFGVNEFSARFFTIISALLLLAVLYRFAKKIFNNRTALFSAAIMGTSLAFLLYSQINELDMLLTALMCWGLMLFYEGFELQQSPKLKIRACWALLGLGCLVKGPVALALPVIVIGPYLLLSGQIRRFRDCRPFEGFAIFTLISAPWFIAISRAEPEFFQFFFVREHLQRYTSSVHQRKGSPLYFVPVLLLGLFPWVAALFQALWAAGKKLLARARDYKLTLFLLLWAVMIFVFFSVSGSKRPPYILPVIPPLCLLLAAYWDERWETPSTAHRSIFITAGALYALFALAFSVLHFYELLPLEQNPRPGLMPAVILLLGLGDLYLAWHKRTMRALFRNLAAFGGLFILVGLDSASALDPLFSRKAQAAIINTRAKPGDVVSTYHADYDRNCQSLSFYTARRVAIVGDEGELKTGSKLAPGTDEYFPNDEPYLKRYTGEERFFAIINKRRLRALAGLAQGKVYQLDKSPGPLALVSNRLAADY